MTFSINQIQHQSLHGLACPQPSTDRYNKKSKVLKYTILKYWFLPHMQELIGIGLTCNFLL